VPCGHARNSCSSRIRVDGRTLSRVLFIAWAASALGLAGCEREPEPVPPRIKQVFHLNPYEKDFGYSQAVLIDKTLYISGSVAVDQNGRLVAPGDMAGQMRAAYTNIRRTHREDRRVFQFRASRSWLAEKVALRRARTWLRPPFVLND